MTQTKRLLAKFALIFILLGSALGIARGQSTANLSELQKQSALLTPEQRNTARALFETGFSLWQSGEFGPAGKAFKRGLELDPANAQANFYYGDSLRKSKQRKEAAVYFKRAALLGADTPEGFKAESALEEISKPVAITEMTQEELRDVFIGKWEGHTITLPPGGDIVSPFEILGTDKGELVILGKYERTFLPDVTLMNLKWDGARLEFCSAVPPACNDGTIFTVRLVSAQRLEGKWSTPTGHSGVFFALKK